MAVTAAPSAATTAVYDYLRICVGSYELNLCDLLITVDLILQSLGEKELQSAVLQISSITRLRVRVEWKAYRGRGSKQK